MGLGAHAVDGNAGGDPLLDLADKAGGLGVGGAIEAMKEVGQSQVQRTPIVRNLLVVVDVQLRVGIGGTSGLEGNADEVLAEDIVEDGRPEGAIFVEYFVHNILAWCVST